LFDKIFIFFQMRLFQISLKAACPFTAENREMHVRIEAASLWQNLSESDRLGDLVVEGMVLEDDTG
jgi:hypothetical protein